MDSMQASLESEQRAKAEALRIKKKLEGDINELEIALDHSNKANNEAQKSIKRYQVNRPFVDSGLGRVLWIQTMKILACETYAYSSCTWILSGSEVSIYIHLIMDIT